MTRLHYLPEGNPTETGRWHPGWPASDHEEDDVDLAVPKVESGLYEALPDAPQEPATLPQPSQNPRATAPVAQKTTAPVSASDSPPTRPGG